MISCFPLKSVIYFRFNEIITKISWLPVFKNVFNQFLQIAAEKYVCTHIHIYVCKCRVRPYFDKILLCLAMYRDRLKKLLLSIKLNLHKLQIGPRHEVKFLLTICHACATLNFIPFLTVT